MFEGKICLITGGTGSWGSELTRKLLENHAKEIRIFSRNEFAQVRMQRAFANDPRLNFITGDVRDYDVLRTACKGVDYIFHLAALKHVPVCEKQPEEALKTNVNGTLNVIRASVENEVSMVVDVSTDKAVDPINFYGITKFMGEKLITTANALYSKTRFVCVRGGNVLGTNGSVVPLFKQQILEGNAVTLTSRAMTRFFLTVSEAIEMVLRATQVAVGGEIFVMNMQSCRIVDLIDVLGQCLTGQPVKIRDIGIRPGEKLHEVLISSHEVQTTHQYDKQYYVILPQHASQRLQTTYQHLPIVTFHHYGSNHNLMNMNEIETMLRKGGILP